MKKFIALICCFILGASLLCGCSFFNKEGQAEPETFDASALYGTWAEDTFESGFVFWEDGYGLDTFWNLYFVYSATENTIVMTYDSDTYGVSRYNYTLDGDQLTMTRIDTKDTDTFTYYKSDAKYEHPEILETDENGEVITEAEAAEEVPAEGEVVPIEGEEVPVEGEVAEENAEG